MPSSTETRCPAEPEAAPRCELEENLEALRGPDLFSAVPLDRLRLYAYMCRRERYRAGEFLFRQGEPATRGFVVLSGRVQIIREYPEKHVVLNQFGPGEFFGGVALLGDVKYVFSARAATDCDLVTLDRESFRKLLMQFPDVVMSLLDTIVKRIVSMEERLIRKQADELACASATIEETTS